MLTSGAVTIEPVFGDRIQGRFDGTARLLHGTATIDITAGRFDVPNNLPGPVN